MQRNNFSSAFQQRFCSYLDLIDLGFDLQRFLSRIMLDWIQVWGILKLLP